MSRPAPHVRASRRDALALAAGVAALSMLVIGFVGFETTHAYRDAIASGRSRAANLALVLDEQTRGIVQAIDLSLLGVADMLRLAPGTPPHDEVLTERLRSRLGELPHVRALFVIGADGFLIQDTDRDTPKVSFADRDYFRVHADNPDSGLYIGRPMLSRSPGAPWFLSVSRRITLEDGRFYGVAVAAVEPKYFARFYDDIQVGEGGAVALLHRSGIIVARSPEHENAVGLSIADGSLFTRLLPSTPAGLFDEPSRVDGVERVYSYRALDSAPLVVAVGLSTESLLADWRHQARLAAAAGAAIVLTLIAGAFAIHRRRARELLAAQRLQQVEKSEALGRMTSSVAHDFNNVLAIISGNLELVAEHLPEGGAPRNGVRKALDAADRGARIIAQLLAFARRQPLSATQESPSALVGAMADLLAQAVRPCELLIAAAPDGWTCEIDAGQFERAMLNLVVNARDASSDGRPVAIEIANVSQPAFDRAWPDLAPGDYVVCRVRDQGEGMPPEIVRRASEPFFTTKDEDQGTGLGLSQVFGFARQSGGTVTIESVVGTGTTITLVLPRSSAPAGPTPKEGDDVAGA
jgi:signal transduction histidine kinase